VRQRHECRREDDNAKYHKNRPRNGLNWVGVEPSRSFSNDGDQLTFVFHNSEFFDCLNNCHLIKGGCITECARRT
jgi:hypothetical protein